MRFLFSPIHRGLLLVATVLAAEIGWAESRVWTTTEDAQRRGTIVDASETHVTLLIGGDRYELELTRFIPEDREFVANWLRQREANAASPNENWEAPWPKNIKTDVSPEIEIVREDADSNTFIYRSPSFEYHADVRLSKSVVERFAVRFEATAEYCRQLPLSLEKAHSEKRHRVELYEKESTYRANGGPPDSAGVYIGRRDVVMVPLTSLGVERVGNRFIVDHDKHNKTLSHEIVHQLTDPPYYLPGALGWFSEGVAEYVGLTPYRMGTFTNGTARRSIVEYVTAYGTDGSGGRALGEEITLPPLERWFLTDYSSFTANGMLNYGAAVLVFYYFAHFDGEEDAANLKNFCRALKAGKQGPEALASLLNGRSYAALQEQMSKAWRGRGIRLEFR